MSTHGQVPRVRLRAKHVDSITAPPPRLLASPKFFNIWGNSPGVPFLPFVLASDLPTCLEINVSVPPDSHFGTLSNLVPGATMAYDS